MLHKQQLFVFPTSRSIRLFINDQKEKSKLLPFTLTIDEFLKKSIILEDKRYIDEEQKVLFLNQSIKNIDISKLGISNNFTKFLNQSDYIYRFFLELASEDVNIDDIKTNDTYDYYSEHLEILTQIRKNYIDILEDNNCIDKINLKNHYKINIDFLSKFKKVDFVYEGYFTKQEFEIVENISKSIEVNLSFYSNEYNQKSLELFKKILSDDLEIGYKYTINISTKTIIEKEKAESKQKKISIKSFASRINQIAFIKSSIVDSINNGIEPSSIALVLPDESFSEMIELFDNEKYFNYAMGKSIKNYNLYQVAYAINNYIRENEVKNIKNLEYLQVDRNIIDKNIKNIWNQIATKDKFIYITDFIKSYENDEDLLLKYDELIYKLKILLFSNDNSILVKDLFKIFLQKLSSIKLDDINSGKVTVLGLLETRAVSFDSVIICDFNESYIPKRSIKDKFLSTSLKENVNLPTSYDREMLQKYYYKRLTDSTKNLYISYVSSNTNQISRFSNELFGLQIDDKLYDNQYNHILYNNHNLVHFEDEIVDKIDLSKLTWSATSLKVFLDCKRKFYLQYILNIKEHDISLKPKSYELGNIVHAILEKYYKIVRDNNELSFDTIEKLFDEYKSTNAFLILDLEVWKKKLYEFYLFDTERMDNRKVIELEKPFNIEFDGIKLKGVIDRIDLYDDIYEVIDYKTSSMLKIDTAKNYEKSKDFQLEFYYLAMSELYKTDKINTYYYDLNNTKLIEEVMLDQKLELLTKIFDDIKEASKDKVNFSKCEEKSTCQFCIYKTVCNRE